jgi:cysteinyl-tRNA synthetase
MSLISDLEELSRACVSMKHKTRAQQELYFKLICGMVKMHQEHRIAKNYAVSDAIRSLLFEVGIRIIQGTAAYKYDKIPDGLKGRQVDDTWELIK